MALTPRELFDETFTRCMSQATKPIYTEITRIEENRSAVVADVIIFDGTVATFEVMKPDVVSCYGFGCLKNHGPPSCGETEHGYVALLRIAKKGGIRIWAAFGRRHDQHPRPPDA